MCPLFRGVHIVGFHCILYMYGVILICCHFNMYRPAIKHDVESSCVADEPQVSLQICTTMSLLHYSLTHCAYVFISIKTLFIMLRSHSSTLIFTQS